MDEIIASIPDHLPFGSGIYTFTVKQPLLPVFNYDGATVHLI
jgi:hypothetical protein